MWFWSLLLLALVDYCACYRYPDKDAVRQVVSSFPAFIRGHSEPCRNHSLLYINALDRLDLWALKMLDATAKLPSGILNGNTNQYGDFDECLAVRGPESLQGKYCLVYVDLKLVQPEFDNLVVSHRIFHSSHNDPGHRIARFSTLSWGVCVPSSCTADDVHLSMAEFLGAPGGANISLKVDPEMCYVQNLNSKLSLGGKVTLSGFLSILVFVIVGTLLDVRSEIHHHTKAGALMRAFSLRRSWSTMTSEKGNSELSCVHGARALNSIGLLVFHKSAAIMFLPFINRTTMAQTFGLGWSVIGRTAIIYTDTFVLISGLLASRSLLVDMDKNRGNINYVKKYLSRYFRYLPNFAAVILFCTYLAPRLSNGPQWNLTVNHHAELCKSNMWRNLLMIHNFYGFEQMCLTHTHHLAVDTQLYLVAPFFVLLLWNNKFLGLAALFTFALHSTILRYITTYNQRLSTVLYNGISVEQMFDTANQSYTLPAHRLTVYLMGIFLGYVLHRRATYQINKVVVAFGWIFAFYLALTAMFGPYHMSYSDYQYDPHQAALYNALSPVYWGVFVTWGIFCGVTGYGGFLNTMMSWRGFRIFSHLSYSIYLTQFPVYFYNVGSQRTAEYYTPWKLFELGEVAVIFMISLALTLFIDLPFQEVRKLLWDTDSKIASEKDTIIKNKSTISRKDNGIPLSQHRLKG